jgi:GNAT superfamily N-acetyltransferase
MSRCIAWSPSGVGKLVGLAHYIFHRSTIQIGSICYLQDLFTSVAARGHGIGRALIEAVYDRARSASCGRVYWQTHETNSEAMRLYEKVAKRSALWSTERHCEPAADSRGSHAVSVPRTGNNPACDR